jgi:hypothetical protein
MPADQQSGAPRRSRNPWLTVLSLALIVVYGLFIEWYWGWGRIADQWGKFGWSTAAIAIGLLVVTYFIRCHRIADYFSGQTKGRFGSLFRLTQIHNLLNIMLPFRAGEASFPVLMRTEFSVPLASGTAALLVMRLLDVHALACAGLLGLALSRANIVLPLIAWAIFLILPVLLFQAKKPIMDFLSRRLPPRLESFLQDVDRGLPATLSGFFRAWFLTIANWLIKVAVIAWIFMAFAGVDLVAALGGALGGELSSVTPFHAPGVGTYPAGIIAGALAFGAHDDAIAVSRLGEAAVNVHLMIVVSALFGTGIGLLFGRNAAAKP